MIALPLSVLGWAMTLLVAFLAFLFWRNPQKGLEFATHREEQLTQVMVNRYIVIALVMGGALYSANPGYIAFVFAVTGIGPASDAWIYYRAGESYHKHLPPAILSAVVAIWAFVIHLQAGAI